MKAPTNSTKETEWDWLGEEQPPWFTRDDDGGIYVSHFPSRLLITEEFLRQPREAYVCRTGRVVRFDVLSAAATYRIQRRWTRVYGTRRSTTFGAVRVA